MSVIRINGAELALEPVKMSVQKSDLYSDSTGRSAETGRLIAYPVRLGVRTLELEFHGTDSQISSIENAIAGSIMSVDFRDNGEMVTGVDMYPSDRSKELESILDGVGRYRLSFSLIEY